MFKDLPNKLVYLQKMRRTGQLKTLIQLGIVAPNWLGTIDRVEHYDKLVVEGYTKSDAIGFTALTFNVSDREVYRSLKKLEYEDRNNNTNEEQE